MRKFFLFFILFLLFTTPCLSQQKIKFSLSNPQQPDSCKNKKFPWNVLLVGGALEPDKSLYINSKGIFNISGISFNTVDGFYYGTGVELRKQLTADSRISFEPFASYAFSRKNFDWHLISTYHYAQDTYIVKGEIGNKSSEFNTLGGPSELNNSLFSLFLRENYARKYMHEYMRLTNEIKIFSNLKLIASASYSRNMPLENNSDYSFWFRNKKEFSPNMPDNEFYKMKNHEDLYSN